jgi:hypothetical protein
MCDHQPSNAPPVDGLTACRVSLGRFRLRRGDAYPRVARELIGRLRASALSGPASATR